jgi:hypothetical protein
VRRLQSIVYFINKKYCILCQVMMVAVLNGDVYNNLT